MSGFVIVWNVVVLMLTAALLLSLGNWLAALFCFLGFFCWKFGGLQ